MTPRVCETCGTAPPRIQRGPWAGQTHMHDYCVHCSKDLCEACIANKKCRESANGKHEVESDDDAPAAPVVNVMNGGTGWPPDDRTPAQVAADEKDKES